MKRADEWSPEVAAEASHSRTKHRKINYRFLSLFQELEAIKLKSQDNKPPRKSSVDYGVELQEMRSTPQVPKDNMNTSLSTLPPRKKSQEGLFSQLFSSKRKKSINETQVNASQIQSSQLNLGSDQNPVPEERLRKSSIQNQPFTTVDDRSRTLHQ